MRLVNSNGIIDRLS